MADGEPGDVGTSSAAPALFRFPAGQFTASPSPDDYLPRLALTVSDDTGQPAGQVCDVDVDGDVDSVDIGLILAARNTPADGPNDPRDPDRDGFITVLDVRACYALCTLPDCAEPGANTPPTADAGADQVVQQGAVVQLDGSGSADADGDPLVFAWSFTSQPAGSAAVLSDPAAVAPTFAADAAGLFTLQLVVNDGQLDSLPATVSITVQGANAAPVANDQDLSTPEDTPLAITLTGSDADGDALTFTVTAQPANGTLSGTAPDLTYTPDADFNGGDAFSFVANDGSADSLPATVTIDVTPVNDAPTAADVAATTDEDTPVGVVLAGADVDGDPLTFAVLTQPANGTLSGAAPDLVYTPDANFAGVDTFTFGSNDGQADSLPATATITVNGVNDAPVADDQALTTPEDTPLAVTLTGQDIEGDPLTFTVLTQPANGTLAGTAPDLTYTPDANFNGDDSFTFLVNDGQLDSLPATVSITVQGANDAPVADDQDRATPEDTALAITLTGSDADGDALTFTVTAQPANGTLSGTAPDLVYTPDADFNGGDAFSFVANDGSADSLPATVTIDVTPVNDAPTAEDVAVTTDEDTPVDVVLAGADVEGDALTFTVQAQPTNGALTGTAPNLVYTPAANFGGTDSFTYVANDGQLDSLPATATITVNAINDAPLADDQDLSTPEDTPLAITLTGSDAEGDPLTYTVLTQPANGTLGGAAPNLVYTPDPDVNGDDSFTFLVNDGAADSPPATVAVAVLPVNDAPVADNQALDAVANVPLAVTLTAQDVDGDTLTYNVLTQPANGTLTGAAPALEYTADAGFAGTDQFTFAANDGTVDSNTATVTLQVVDENNDPVITSTPITTATPGANYSYQVTADDPDGDTLGYFLSAAPAGMTISAAGLVEWVVPGAGNYPVTIDVTDGNGGLTQQSYTIAVSDNSPPEFTRIPLLNAPLGEAYAGLGAAVDPDGDAVAFGLASGPAGSTLTDLGNGEFRIDWLSSGNIGDATPFVITATDATGATSTLNLAVIVTGDRVNRSHLGTDFWGAFGINFRNTSFGLGAMPLDDPGRQLQLVIGAPDGANATVEIIGLGFLQTVNLAAGETARIDVPIGAMLGQSGLSDRPFRVFSDAPITVAGINWAFATTDAFLVLPTSANGTDHVVSGYRDVLFQPSFNEIYWAVVASEDDTTFTVERLSGLPRRVDVSNEQPVQVTLNRGQAYAGFMRYAEAASIVADRPIAVFSGSSCANIPFEVGTCDHLWQQFVPSTTLASEYLVAPLATRTESLYRVIASEDDTRVSINGVYSALLDSGEAFESILPGPLSITGSRPITAIQYAAGNGLDRDVRMDELADPFMLNLAPVGAFLADYTVVVPSGEGVFRDQPNNTIRPPIENHYLGFVIPAAIADGLYLDDALVDTSAFEPVPGSPYLAGNVEVLPGTHRVSANEQFGVTVYGFGIEESYGFYAGLIFPDGNPALQVEVVGPAAPLVAGDEEACFDITVRDLAGARVPRARYTIDVVGTIPRTSTGFSDRVGDARFCYPGAAAGTDTVTVAVAGDSEVLTVDWLPNDNPATNGAPAITSFPELVLYEPTFSYPVTTVDPDGDIVALSFDEAPNGVAIINDVVTWTPPVPADREPTTHAFTLVADDGNGGVDEQRFELKVFYPAIFVERFPDTRSSDRFSGDFASTFNHLGGDPDLLVAEMIEGPGTVFWAGIVGTTPIFNVDGRSNQIQIREYTDEPNLMCRSVGGPTGQFSLRELWQEDLFDIIRTAVAGPVYDSNGDSIVDDDDDIHAALLATDAVGLFNITTRELEWQTPIAGERSTNHIAIANVDADIEREVLAVVRLATDNRSVLTAFDDDGTVLWRSDHNPFLTAFSSAQMPVLAVDLDSDGTTEILLGPYVYDNLGNLLWQFDDARIGFVTNRYALPLAADLDGDGQREVLFANEVRDTDGTLLWTIPYSIANQRPQVFYAVGDLTGDGTLEIAASIRAEDGDFHHAFDIDGQPLWPAVPGVAFGVPVVADFDRDGDNEIFTPAQRTIISAEGTIESNDGGGWGFNIFQPITDIDRDGIPERLGFDNSWNYRPSEIFSTRNWGGNSFRNQTNGFANSLLWQSFLIIDPDHDGESEVFVSGVFSSGLFEAIGQPYPLATRSYSQVVDFDQPVIGLDTDLALPANPGIADAWVGRIRFAQIDEDNFTLSVQVRNKGLAPIDTPVTVQFISGRPDTGTLIGETTLPGLPVASLQTASIPATYDDRNAVMSARLVFDPSVVQCDDRNDAVEGELHTIEMRDGDTPYRINRYSYLHQQWFANLDVVLFSAPINTTITLGQTYTFDVDAGWNSTESSIGNSILYTLNNASLAAGMTVDALTGQLSWTPTFGNVGSNAFSVTASSVDDVATRNFTIEVLPRANEAPVITSTPPGAIVLVGQTFDYDVDATDADNDTLTYALDAAPAGMTIDPASGLIAWAPQAADVGLAAVTVSVDDGFGGVATQSFSVQVGVPGNTGPTIDSAPPLSAKATFEYRYQVDASDPDGDFLAYSIETGPAGMTIDGNGLLTWTPPVDGLEPVVVRVSDGQAFVEQGWTLTVSAADIPLQASITATPAVADLGSDVLLTIGFSGAAGAVNFSLTVDGVPVPVAADGTATVLADAVGIRTATAIVSDPFVSDSATTTFTVIDPNSTSTPPVVTLQAPDFEEEVTAPRDAIGTVTDPENDLLSWFLAIQPRGAEPTEFTIIAEGTDPLTNEVIGRIDPTMLLNGLYSVILQATDAAGNVSQDVRVIRVTGDLKVGNFSITFEDFSAPVAGIPVTVQRTYDTRRRSESLDFGFGWTVDYQNVRLQESRDIGFSWSLIEERVGFFSNWCVRPNGDPTVTVRLPDGEVETFVARAEPECNQLVPVIDVNIVFEATDGTDSTLEQTDFGLVRIVNGNIVDLGAPGEPIDPDRYRLTTTDGFVYELDQNFGIRRVTDSNDNSLTFSSAGVVHSQGFALDFIRDGAGRISSIVAPDGSTLSYAYDVNGDLVSFIDQVGNVTTFTYTDATSHYLEDIIDPRGIAVTRNEYDADGRLIAIIDANGNRIEYTHDITGQTETIRDRRGNSSVYVYDDEGNILSETNALGETITRTYDADRNVLSMTDPLGNTTSWTYDARGNVLSQTDALGNVTTSTYDSRDLLLTQVDALGNTTMTNAYDTRNRNLLSTTDALGNVTTFFWDAGIGGGCSTGASRGATDAEGNRTTIQPICAGPFAELPRFQEDARGVRTTFTYDGLGRQTSALTDRTDENGNVRTLTTTMVYDGKGRITEITDPDGNVTRTEYNLIDKEAATVNANGNRTEFEYDDRGNHILTRFPDGTSETMGYDAADNVISRTDRLGRTTRMTYDAANRRVETIYPDDTPGNDLDNPRTTNEYDAAGRLTVSIDELGNRTEFGYDAAGRRTLIRDALGNETTLVYDARGLQTATVDSLGRRTEFVYDAMGRLLETIQPDDTPADSADNPRSTAVYDGLGRKVSETDLAGLTTQFEYDPVGNLIAVVDALGQRTEYGYDERSNKIAQTDAELRVTEWAYDDVGRQTARTLPGGQRETFSYDANGNLTGHTDFNGAVHDFEHDSLDRQITANYADGTTITTTYTAVGEVESVTDDRGTTAMTYDERDRLLSVTYPNGRRIDYTYDDADNRTSLTTTNQAITYTFDALNRLATVSDDAGLTTYGYDAVGNRASIDHANGTRTEYVYDEQNRLTQLTQLDQTATPFDRHGYTLGLNGNRLQHTELSGRVVDYSYDDLYRLTEEAVTDATIGNRTTSFTYDAVGNRLTRIETTAAGTTTTTYAYDVNDRLLSETAVGAVPDVVTYTYDANGNTLSRADGAGTTTYAWDSRNRLVDLNSGQTTYLYDANGIRMSQTTGGLTTNYLVDPNTTFAQVIEESLDNNTFAETRYTFGDDLVHQIRRLDAVTNRISTYHYDGIGSTRQLTDTAGVVSDRYTYDSFGELEAVNGVTANNYLFAGESFDADLGQYYLRARYYDPATGRFQSLDPFPGFERDPLSLHKYLYAHANPVANVDPTGLVTLGQLSTAIRVQATLVLRTTGTRIGAIAGRNRITRILFGHPPDNFGLVGEVIIEVATNALTPFLGSALDAFSTAAAFGTAAHSALEEGIKAPIARLEPFPDVTLEAELFFFEPGRDGSRQPAGRRERGSIGIDILVSYRGEPVLGLDLKTGRGSSQRRNNKLLRRIGVDIIEIKAEFF